MTAISQSATKIYFTIDKEKVDVVNSFKRKIEEIFDVDVYFEIEDNSSWNSQWVAVEGKSCDCQDTKEYIIAICCPEERSKVKCQCEDIGLKFEIFRGIEKNTRAVLQVCKNDIVEISGSVLSVTLAISSLEELLGAKLDTETKFDSGSHRLDSVLRETLSQIDNVESNLEDYQSVPSNVKRAMIDTIILDTTLDHIHDDELFEDGANGGTVNRKTCFTKGFQSAASSATTSKENQALPFQPKENQGVKSNSEDKFVDLRKFAEAVGYSSDEIEEGLLYINSSDVCKPTEFLPMLSKIRERKREWGLLPNEEGNILKKETTPHIHIGECMDSDDNDVIFVGETNIRKGRQSQDSNDVSIIEIEDEQEVLKTRYRNQKKETTTSHSADDKADKDQTQVMCVWDGVMPSKLQDGILSRSDTKGRVVIQANNQPVVLQPSDKTAISKEHDVVDSRTNKWESTWDKVPSYEMTNIAQGSEGAAVSETVKAVQKNGELRYVVVDGSNVARAHGNNGSVFSCIGIKLCVDYFLKLGHKKITVFVPGWRQKRGTATYPIKNQEILEQLKQDGYLAFTPHKQLPSGQRVASYDDRFILELADKEDGVIISNDQYRDFFHDKASYRRILEERCIPFVFVADNFMLPEDPYGQKGPMLADILVKPDKNRPVDNRQPQQLHYQQYYNYQPIYQQQQHQQLDRKILHPPNNPPQCFQPNQVGFYQRRENTRSHSEILKKRPTVEEVRRDKKPNYSAPLLRRQCTDGRKYKQYERLQIETDELFNQLKIVFCEKEQEEKIIAVLKNHSCETDVNKLTNYCLNAMSF